MKKLKSVSLALLFMLTVSITMNNGQTLMLSPIVKQGSISVTKDDTANTVTVTNGVMKIVLSKGGDVGGVRPIEWHPLAQPELELAAKSKPSWAMGNRYPLWDWPSYETAPEWPGELTLGAYGTNATDGTYELPTESVSISFNHTCTITPIVGLQVIKVLTFYQDKYYFDMQVILRNPTTGDIKIGPPGWANVGYSINAAGYLEPLSDLYQGYQDGETPVLGLNLIGERRDAKELRWVAVYNKGTGAIIALKPYNATGSVRLEQDPSGRSIWGSEARIEYLPVTIAASKEVVYVLKVYGGPPDIPQLTEIGMSNLAAGVAFSAEMDSDRFVYSKGDICKYTLNLTNNLGEDLTNVDVNVTFWSSDQFATRSRKISDVYSWRNLTVQAKKTLPLAGNLNITRDNGMFALYAEVFQKGESIKTITSLPLTIVVVTGPVAEPLIVSFVWNLHQPYLLDSSALSVFPSTALPGPPNAFLTTWIQDYVEESSKPYLWHALLLDKYPSINVTFNLQPTLLYQWNASAYAKWWKWWYNTATGYLHWEKAQEEPSEACGEAIEKYKSLASSGRIELLASPYYYPVMPILLAKNWTSDLIDQLELGKNYTQELMEVEPTGLWVPEMAFNMSLVPIINETGLQYIVLDHRMLENVKTLGTPSYEPWYVKDPKTDKTVVAFFRARYLKEEWVVSPKGVDLSNRLETEWSTATRHSQSARELLATLFSIWWPRRTLKNVVTVALDEWVSTGGPVANKTLDDIYSTLNQSSYWIKTKTLKSALKDVPPKQTVTNLLEGWSENVTSLAALVGEPNSTVQKMWDNVTLAREMIMNYSEPLSAEKRATDEKLKTALKYLYIAETSNWFKNPDEAIGPITGRQQVNSYLDAIKQLFVEQPFDFWKAYGAYILGGSSLAAAIVIMAIVARRKRKVKAAP